MPHRVRDTISHASLPGLTRQSIFFVRLLRRVMDTRVEPAYDDNIGGGKHVHRITPQTPLATRLPRNGRMDLPGPGGRIVAALWRRRADGKIRCDHRAVQRVRRIVSHRRSLPVVLHHVSRDQKRLRRCKCQFVVSCCTFGQRARPCAISGKERAYGEPLQFESSWVCPRASLYGFVYLPSDIRPGYHS
jgi:hypothetical protein